MAFRFFERIDIRGISLPSFVFGSPECDGEREIGTFNLTWKFRQFFFIFIFFNAPNAIHHFTTNQIRSII